MRDRQAGRAARELRRALGDWWQLDVAALRYAPVGGGSYHWIARDRQGRRWFVTVDDLDGKHWLGDDRIATAEGMRTAMDAAHALRHQAGLSFVLAPIKARNDVASVRLSAQYAVSLFPYLDGVSGSFGAEPSAVQRRHVVDMLAELHLATPAAAPATRRQVGLGRRADLETALRETAQPWLGGPLSEQARGLLAASADQVRRLLGTFDELAEHVSALEPVITHGEPHPANLLATDGGSMLIDWDTVGLAPPERDLWWVVRDGSEESGRYTRATGWPVDPAALSLYRLRWALDDISVFVHALRSAHQRTADSEHALLALKITLASAP